MPKDISRSIKALKEMLEELEDKGQLENYVNELDVQFGLDERGFHKTAEGNLHNLMKGRFVDYQEEYGPLLIYHMSKGHTFKSFAGVLGISPKLLESWYQTFPEFAECRAVAESCHLLEWESVTLSAAKGYSKGNAAAIIFALKNLFPDQYKDKREVEHQGNIMVVDTGIRRQNKVINAEFREIDEVPQLGMEENGDSELDCL